MSKLALNDVNIFYGDFHAVQNVNMQIPAQAVTAFIGPSGCGKSTVLRTINRMHEVLPGATVDGKLLLDGEDIYDRRVDPVQLRARVGMVFQKPNPFPKSIYDNVAYGPRIHGLARNKAELDGIVEKALRGAALWNEVKDRLDPQIDNMAERIQQLDGVAVGTVEEVARATRLKPYPTDLTSVADHLREITDRFRSYGERVRAAIDTTDDAGDASTADVLTEASRQADKDLWFLQSHLD